MKRAIHSPPGCYSARSSVGNGSAWRALRRIHRSEKMPAATMLRTTPSRTLTLTSSLRSITFMNPANTTSRTMLQQMRATRGLLAPMVSAFSASCWRAPKAKGTSTRNPLDRQATLKNHLKGWVGEETRLPKRNHEQAGHQPADRVEPGVTSVMHKFFHRGLNPCGGRDLTTKWRVLSGPATAGRAIRRPNSRSQMLQGGTRGARPSAAASRASDSRPAQAEVAAWSSGSDGYHFLIANEDRRQAGILLVRAIGQSGGGLEDEAGGVGGPRAMSIEC